MTKTLQSLLAGIACICVFGIIHYVQLSGDESAAPAEPGSSHIGVAKVPTSKEPGGPSSLAAGVDSSADVASLIAAGDFARAKKRLLELASYATDEGDQALLARLLAELGEVALAQGDTDAAGLYLAESLDVYEQLGDEVSAAGVYTLIGRLHLLERKRAREASHAYDQLLIARWRISHDQFTQAEQALKQIVITNLDLNRFGAAASAYETLFSGYSKEQQFDKAENAGIEAVRLLAASGRRYQANTMLARMRDLGISESVYIELEAEIAQLTREFDDNANAIAVARALKQLYNQLMARGDVIQAWRFREKAEQTLARVNSRARYRRQSDVLVELYRSNDSKRSARASLQHAREVFLRHGLNSQAQHAENLQAEIF